MWRFGRYSERQKLGKLSTRIANLPDRHDLPASQSDSTQLKLTLTLTLSTPWMQVYLGTVVCKFGAWWSGHFPASALGIIAKWPFKVIQGHPFRCQWRASKGVYSTVYCGLECEGSEDIASKRSENRHLRRPHSHLTPLFQQTPVNIHINLTLLETRIPGLQFCRWQCIGSSSNFRTVLSESQKRQLIGCRAQNRF